MEMLVLATSTLLFGFIDDLRSRKVHNVVLLALLPIVLVGNFYFRGFEGSVTGLSAGCVAMAVTIPLFILGIFGGGDVKLFALFALCLDPASTIWTLVYSILWGGFFGITRAALQKNLMSLVRNTYRAGRGQRVQPQEVSRVPYTFALLLGWFTELTMLHSGGLL